jgi:hypothetical protein
LRITPSSPRIGEPATATFTVVNTSGDTVLVPAFLMVARDLQDAVLDFHPAGVASPDLPVSNISIPAGGTHTYSVTRTFTKPGIHLTWPAYLDPATVNLGAAERKWLPLAIDNAFPDDTRFRFIVRTDTGDDPILIGAGDIAGCTPGFQDKATAALLESTPGTVFTLGDNAYPDGTEGQFRDCYGASWGREPIKSRTFPSVGNHEYNTPGASGYYTYFGAAAGPPGKGYYSYDLGAWHIVVLNSCFSACGPGSMDDQLAWLQRDLAEHPTRCNLAYWHHAIFTDGEHFKDPDGDIPENHWMRDAWKILHHHGVDVVLNGHDHIYQRFHRLDKDGQPNPGDGIREFVVGTGGVGLRRYERSPENALSAYPSEAEKERAKVNGVLKLTLRTGSYEWELLVSGEAAGTVLDPGRTFCH